MKKIIFACGFLSVIAACSPQTSGPIIVENPPSSELNRWFITYVIQKKT